MILRHRLIIVFPFISIVLILVSSAIFGLYGLFVVSIGLSLSATLLVCCPRCGKSPFVRYYRGIAIGLFIPERTCSKCHFNFSGKIGQMDDNIPES